ncbi:MAG: hypothetical protein JF615_06760, partial [Asticcacaulis sp.]|nr:hypothetical protein [Asticcacaulis sp.]
MAPTGERGAFRIINSWGTGWGDGGYLWVSYPAMMALVQEAYVFKDILPPMIPRDGVLAPALAMTPVNIQVSAQPQPAAPLAPKPVTPQPVAPPPPPPPPPQTDLIPELTAMAREFKTGEVQVRRLDDGYRLTGYGCVDEVQYLRARVGKYNGRVSVVMDETPWPACEIRGLLKDAVARPGVAARVVNLASDAPPVTRGVQITEDDTPVTTTAILRNGDPFEIDVEVQDQAPYVQIFYLQADQSAKEIWRGEVKGDGSGRRRLMIGAPGTKIHLTASRPYGTEAVLVLAGKGPVTAQPLEKNVSEVGFMDTLRANLATAVKADPSIRAQIVQVEVRETPAVAQTWLVTPEELDNFGPGEPLFGAGAVTALGDPWGPKIVLTSPQAASLSSLTDGSLALQVAFRPTAGAHVDPSTLRVEYRTAVGWRDITDRVLSHANINAGGLSTSPLSLPAGQHRIRLSIMDDRGRVGITELSIRTGN